MLLDYLEDNVVLVIPSSIKNGILKKINNLDTIYNIKIMAKEELLSALTFTYDEKAIYYLINKYHYKYDIALMYLNNIKYLDNKDYTNPKLQKLKEIKDELEANNLLIYNKMLASSLKRKKTIIYGYDYLSNYDKKVFKEVTSNAFFQKTTYRKSDNPVQGSFADVMMKMK